MNKLQIKCWQHNGFIYAHIFIDLVYRQELSYFGVN
jgi:hypothetical protein